MDSNEPNDTSFFGYKTGGSGSLPKLASSSLQDANITPIKMLDAKLLSKISTLAIIAHSSCITVSVVL
ncbi:unnamed protein product [Lactuca virosa]|uniref:Uncharacterized protein n=1 Tax=Lactuca virosa TaxID=75947 RepID=A0AAU9LLE1_9ASTR|nr:unnamed protein product [Lactuca virosa]